MKNKAGISPALSVYPFFVIMTIHGEKDTEFCKTFVRTWNFEMFFDNSKNSNS